MSTTLKPILLPPPLPPRSSKHVTRIDIASGASLYEISKCLQGWTSPCRDWYSTLPLSCNEPPCQTLVSCTHTTVRFIELPWLRWAEQAKDNGIEASKTKLLADILSCTIMFDPTLISTTRPTRNGPQEIPFDATQNLFRNPQLHIFAFCCT